MCDRLESPKRMLLVFRRIYNRLPMQLIATAEWFDRVPTTLAMPGEWDEDAEDKHERQNQEVWPFEAILQMHPRFPSGVGQRSAQILRSLYDRNRS